VLRYPAFAGFDPDRFFAPNKVNPDNTNFGPAFGLAWSPSFSSGWLGKLFGDRRTVWRGGYQISYEALYTQIISLDLATSTPNAISIDQRGAATGRGDPNWFAQLPAATPRPPSLLDTQYGRLEKNFRNPYTERWSFGFQRQLPGQALLDVSYIGAEAHKLTTRVDVNPLQPSGLRLYPDFGPRTIRTSAGNSAYHSLQWRADRRFARRFQVTGSYTGSKSLDSTSEGIGQVKYSIRGLELDLRADRPRRAEAGSGTERFRGSRYRRLVDHRRYNLPARDAVYDSQWLGSQPGWLALGPAGHRLDESATEQPRRPLANHRSARMRDRISQSGYQRLRQAGGRLLGGRRGIARRVYRGPQYSVHRRNKQFRREPVQIVCDRRAQGSWSFAGRRRTPSTIRSSRRRPLSEPGSAGCPRPAGRLAVALPEPGFYERRHPQHVGAGQAAVLRNLIDYAPQQHTLRRQPGQL